MIIKITKTIFLILSMLSLNSCMLFAIPAVYAVQQNATYSQDFDYSSQDLFLATLYMLKSVDGTKFTSDTLDTEVDPESVEINGTIDSKDYKGSFVVTIKKISADSSKFTIKYDIFGDKIKSKKLMITLSDILENQSYKANQQKLKINLK